MSRLPSRRVGTRLELEQQEVTFSTRPIAQGSLRRELQGQLSAPRPWDVVRAAANVQSPPARRGETEAFIDQAEDLYRAATAGRRANPLLLYYAFHNLAKALIIARGDAPSLEAAADGISEQSGPGGWELRNSSVRIDRSDGATIFQLLAEALGLPPVIPGSAIAVLDLFPQVVVGHRVYRSATGAPEHFAVIQELQFMINPMEGTVWLDLLFDSGRLARADLTSSRLLSAGGLGAAFREVESDLPGRRRFEMRNATRYNGSPWERLPVVVDAVRPQLWTAVGKGSPLAHHVCLVTTNRVPQVLGLYLLLFALASMTRYRPHRFDQLLSEPIGTFIVDFVSRQPEQLLYLLASEFAAREVVPGAGVAQRTVRNAGPSGFRELPYQVVGRATA